MDHFINKESKEQTKEIVKRSGIKNGIAVVYSYHTTCCVITEETSDSTQTVESSKLEESKESTNEAWGQSMFTDNRLYKLYQLDKKVVITDKGVN